MALVGSSGGRHGPAPTEKGAWRHGTGTVAKRSNPQEEGEELIYRPGQQAGAWLEIPVEVKAREPLHLVIVASRLPDGGRYQVLLNGVAIERPIDLYHREPGRREFHLLDFWPDPGTYTLRLECVGKNAQSGGFALGLESVRLRERRPRVAAYGHDKAKDWRKNPILYR